MASIDRLIKELKESCPPEVDKEQVRRILKYCFSEVRTGGKEDYIAVSEAAKKAYEILKNDYGANEAKGYIFPFNHMGEISIPTKSGRWVKKTYIEIIFKAYEKQQEIEKIFKEEEGE